tara:strand:+ start:1225 stop:1764 length:540 start_codon:yes stop_codon:yes gene_type:complete
MVITNSLETEDNLNYRSLVLGNELDPVFTDNMIQDALENRRKGMENDSRPQISSDEYNRTINDALSKREEEKIIKEYEKNESNNENPTIMDMPLKDIFKKTSETTENFMEDFNIKLIESKNNYEKKYGDLNDKVNWTDFISMHSLAFVEYMKEKDHVLYIGILLVFISVILSIFSISGL